MATRRDSKESPDKVELVEPDTQSAELTEPTTDDDAPVVLEEPDEVPLAEQVDDPPVEDPGPMHPGFVRIYHHELGATGEVPEELTDFWSHRGWTTDPNPPTTESTTED